MGAYTDYSIGAVPRFSLLKAKKDKRTLAQSVLDEVQQPEGAATVRSACIRELARR